MYLWITCFYLFNMTLQLKDPEWAPDFGPTDFVSSWGATVTGAHVGMVP